MGKQPGCFYDLDVMACIWHLSRMNAFSFLRRGAVKYYDYSVREQLSAILGENTLFELHCMKREKSGNNR